MSTTTTMCGQFAEENRHPLFNYEQMYRAYVACRRTKRNKPSALAFEANLEDNLITLVAELLERRYRPGTSICFYTEKPKRREIFAADFRDRVVHHLIYNRISPRWERVFIHRSYACRPEKGTHKANEDLQKMLRRVSWNGRRRAYYLKLDIHNFFMAIDRRILYKLLLTRCKDPEVCWLLHRVVFHEPKEDYRLQDRHQVRHGLAPHKSLFNANAWCGLPIGNLTSQFFANVYLNVLDQFVKHELKCRYYFRYVDDMLLLGSSAGELEASETAIRKFVTAELRLRLNPKARRAGIVSGGVDFVGFVTRPDYSLVRRRTIGSLKDKIDRMKESLVEERSNRRFYRFDRTIQEKYQAIINSYLGHLRYGRCYNVVNKLWQSNSFLARYFRFHRGKVVDRFRVLRRGRVMLRKQIIILHRLFDVHVCLVQVGCFFEIFGDKAPLTANALQLELLRNWRGWRFACGFHQRSLPAMVARLNEMGLAVAVIRQTGRESSFAKERLPSLLIEPRMRMDKEVEA